MRRRGRKKGVGEESVMARAFWKANTPTGDIKNIVANEFHDGE